MLRKLGITLINYMKLKFLKFKCKTCSSDGVTCLTCDASFKLNNDPTKGCVAICDVISYPSHKLFMQLGWISI